ncbi:hypothetical protein EDC01DRAFT_94334 [Geopyxis carbonaria]|nr:hypothetical protein EDC01DRAFT_94334 [Geopyxis carbonaria]
MSCTTDSNHSFHSKYRRLSRPSPALYMPGLHLQWGPRRMLSHRSPRPLVASSVSSMAFLLVSTVAKRVLGSTIALFFVFLTLHFKNLWLFSNCLSYVPQNSALVDRTLRTQNIKLKGSHYGDPQYLYTRVLHEFHLSATNFANVAKSL